MEELVSMHHLKVFAWYGRQPSPRWLCSLVPALRSMPTLPWTAAVTQGY